MEIVQIFIPTRDASLLYIGVNILGIAIGFGIYQFWVMKSIELKRRMVK